MPKRWKLKSHDPDASLRLEGELGVAPLTARILCARGFTDAEVARHFLTPKLGDLPDPMLIQGMADAVKRVCDGVEAGERLWIYTDFDADGVTSAALLGAFFEALGADWHTWLPRRDREGYGLHVEPLEQIAANGGGLVLTADCGITAIEPALAAKRLGLGLVITDHHTPIEELPEADAVVNPKLAGSSYPDEMIAGVGVAWNLAAAVRRELRRRGFFDGERGVDEPDVRELLDLVAIGTVSDVVPLREVNRIFVSCGLAQLNRNRRLGVKALAEVAGVKGDLGSGHLGFQLGPRINAAGRMEGPQEALELLLATSHGDAQNAARKLDDLNRERREEEAGTLAGAIETVQSRGYYPEQWSLVIEGEGYHQGVVGIVASRLVERFYRPAVVLSVDGGRAKGSARSIPGLDLYDALDSCSHLLLRFGGHRAAAGLTLETGLIDRFREEFEAAIRKRLSAEDLIPELEADAEAAVQEITLRTATDLAKLEPFGFGNATPSVMVRGVRVRSRRTMGQGGEHLSLGLDAHMERLEAVAWSKAEDFSWIVPGSVIDVIGAVKTRTWNGRSHVQLVLSDAVPAR